MLLMMMPHIMTMMTMAITIRIVTQDNADLAGMMAIVMICKSGGSRN